VRCWLPYLGIVLALGARSPILSGGGDFRHHRASPSAGPGIAAARDVAVEDSVRDGHSLRDCDQMLREAFELLDEQDYDAALRALQRLVREAPEDLLPELERRARAARGAALDALLARTRLYLALNPGSGAAFSLGAVTRYETEALAVDLEREQEVRLGRVYQGRTIADWAAQRDEYTTLQPDARELVRDARLSAALIAARLKYDERLAEDRTAALRLSRLRTELMRLAAQVAELPGFTSLTARDDPSDPAWQEARRLEAEGRAATQPTSAPALPRAGDSEDPLSEPRP